MGVSYNITGHIPADDTWNKMKEVYNACKRANISIPDEVSDYFNDVDPNTITGMEVDIDEAVYPLENIASVSGWEVDLENLPRKDIRYIRFTISC